MATKKINAVKFQQIKQTMKVRSRKQVMYSFQISERTYYRIKNAQFYVQYKRGISSFNKTMPGTDVAHILPDYKPKPALAELIKRREAAAKKPWWKFWA